MNDVLQHDTIDAVIRWQNVQEWPALLGATMPAWQWALLLGIVLLGALVHGFVGIGLPLIATPLLAMLFGFRYSVLVLIAPTLCIIILSMVVYRGQRSLAQLLREDWPLLILFPLGLWLGVQALRNVRPEVLMLALAVMVTLYLVLDRFGRIRTDWFRQHRAWVAIPFGFIAGFTETSLNVAGPIYLIYYLVLDIPATAIVASLAYFFLAGKTAQAGLEWADGSFSLGMAIAAVPMTVFAVAGFLLGFRWRQRADPTYYRLWLTRFLWLVVVLLVARALR